MDKIFISQIKENQKVDSIFLVKNKTSAVGKTGKQFISLKLSDNTGDIKANIWDNVQKYLETFETGDFIQIKSKSIVFQNELQLNISEIEKINVDKTDLNLFLKSTKFNIEDMYFELSSILKENIGDTFIRKLIELFLEDDSYVKKLKYLPAAKSIHHAYIGGLLEHTLSITKIAVLLSKHYENSVNKDIVISCAFLHDVGKTDELKFEKNTTEYSDEGRLIGHIVLGTNMIEKKINLIQDFPAELRALILHTVLAHHGELEFGSPKRPKTTEAILLHFIDNMDSKVNLFSGIINETSHSPWSVYSKQLDRYILNTRAYMSKDKNGARLPLLEAPLSEELNLKMQTDKPNHKAQSDEPLNLFSQ